MIWRVVKEDKHVIRGIDCDVAERIQHRIFLDVYGLVKLSSVVVFVIIISILYQHVSRECTLL